MIKVNSHVQKGGSMYHVYRFLITLIVLCSTSYRLQCMDQLSDPKAHIQQLMRQRFKQQKQQFIEKLYAAASAADIDTVLSLVQQYPGALSENITLENKQINLVQFIVKTIQTQPQQEECGKYIILLEQLIKMGANINCFDAKGYSLLHSSVETGNIFLVNLLVEHGAQMRHTKCHQKLTPLHLAVIKRFEAITKLLCAAYTTHINTPEILGRTPLHYACCAKYGPSNPGIIITLLERGANPHFSDVTQTTPLHYACWSGHLEAIKLLLQHDLNCLFDYDVGNASPLHYLAGKPPTTLQITNGFERSSVTLGSDEGRQTLAKIFLKYGSNPNQYDNDVKKPSDYARINNYPILAAMLTDTHAGRSKNVGTARKNELMRFTPIFHLPDLWQILCDQRV